MQAGDYVLVTGNGAVEFISPDDRSQEQLRADYAHGTIVGTLADVREPVEDSVVALSAPEPNMAPTLVSLGTLSEKYAEGNHEG